MAKRKTPGPKGQGPIPRKVVAQLKGSEPWKEWVEELARYHRMPISVLIDLALMRYAKETGFIKEPPQR